MTQTLCLPVGLAAGLLCLCASGAAAQTFRVSFDAGLKADRAAGRAEPWVGRDVELVPGRFGKAARIGPRGQLIYAAEQNFQAARGTLACWCRVPERPGPLDVQRIVFVQSKERGYWTYLATMEWQESVFRAMAFDFYHGHGWHDPAGLPALTAGAWHHVALAWDQAEGTKFFLDGKPIGSTWGKQAWWERPTPHAIHLSWPGAAYDELCVYDQVLSDDEVAALAKDNRFELPRKAEPPGGAAAALLLKSVNPVGLQHLPAIDGGTQPTVIRQARVRQILDDKIPAWKVMDGRMNLFWPEWRAPVLGDVDFSGSELSVDLEPGQKLTHLLLRGLVGGCRVFGEREGGYVGREPIIQVPPGMHFLAAGRLPNSLTGLRLPRHEGMKLQEISLFEVGPGATKRPPGTIVTPLTGVVELDTLKQLAAEIRTRTLPHERIVFGRAAMPAGQSYPVAPLARAHFLTEPVAEALPLDAVELKLRFSAPWKEDVWWVRVQDPVNPRRDLMNVPVRVINPAPGQAATFHVVLDFWDVVLDPQSRLWIELLPEQRLTLMTGEASSQVALWPGERAKVLAEFAHTQGQLAYSYWQLGSEAYGTTGSDPNAPGFALLGSITHNRELKLTLEWVRRHAPDHRLTSSLWTITHGKRGKAAVTPRLQPPGAPEWAVWGRELLERFRRMSHHWADRQGPDGQLGGGWNDDTDFPGVFLCLPLLGDDKTQRMFVRVFDGIERTGYLRHGVSRGPADALHATDFLSWRAHLMLFDYGQPRHVERALRLTRELDRRWTKVDGKGHRRFVSTYFSEDGPGWRPRTEIDSAGLVQEIDPDGEGGASRNFLRDPLFCAWYSRNPAVLKFVREMAEGDYARVAATKKAGAYESYPFYSYFSLFGEPRFIDEPVGQLLRDRWSLPIWRRFAERLPGGKGLDETLLKQAKVATASDEQLTTGYVITRDPAYLVRALRDACEELEGGWQFRGGEAGGANDHFYVPGQSALSQMYLGSALTWLRPASIVPPLAVSWQGLDAEVAACVRTATPQALRVAAYNFAEKPRKVRLRVWELSPGQYRLRQGAVDGNEKFDGTPATRELALVCGSFIDLELPPRKVYVIELEQQQARPRPELLPDLAVGDGDVYYDKATDRLKVVVHNIGAAAAKDVSVRFEDPAGNLLLQRTIARLDAPLDLQPKTAVVWMPQPLLHPVDRIVVRIDPDGRIEEITKENNGAAWAPGLNPLMARPNPRSPPMTSRAIWTLAVLAVVPAAPAVEIEVTTIQAVHRHGQTFVTWKDVAEGEEGAKFRYTLYRSEQPITADNLDKAELCYHGVLNSSAKLFGHAFNVKDRLDPAKPYAIIEEGGKPLPPWSGLAVHTVLKPAKAYYAVVATDDKLQRVSIVVPGKSATTAVVEEKPGPIQPIKLYDSKERKTYVAQTSITGQKGLPLSVSLHGSQSTGGPAGGWGDYYLYFGTPAMGYRDGLPGVFTVQENRGKDGNHLLLWPRDAIEHPSGRGAFETMWLGYHCIPQGAKHKEPRVYPFTENRLVWMIDWSINRYGADPQRVSMGGSSMGGLGSINVGFRHPELFAAVYPSTAPFLWWPPSAFHGNQSRDTKALMADGKTSYIDHTNSPKFAAEHHEDLPFLGWAVGRRDGNHNWQEYIDMVKALTANHHGFAFSWNDGGHSEGGRAMGPITKHYPASKLARNRSYPAFGNSSIDHNMGNGSKEDGDREGGINLGFEWGDLVDEEGKWSITVLNNLAKEALTVDVTPRRCQKFKLKPGAEYKWTTSTGASGTIIADKWGLVTVPGAVIKAGLGTVLTIQAQR